MDATRRSRRHGPIALATLGALAALVLAPPAGSAGRYTDATGDGSGAPDITGVSVASDANGQIVFTIQMAGLTLGSPVTYLLLNTDLNLETGEPDTPGADYVFGVDDDGYWFGRWTGSSWDWDTPYTTVGVRGSRSGITISVNRSELGGTGSFNFWARTWAGRGIYDDAPDDGSWSYAIAAGGPEIRGVLAQTNPATGPKAGKPFTITPGGLQLPPDGATASVLPQPESYSCQATLKGRPLRGSGTGGCTFRIPKSARGKQLAAVLTVSYQGATATTRFGYRVR